MRYLFLQILFLFLLAACYDVSNSSNKTTTTENETIDDSFDSFINKFNTDSVFQVSRIVFPLKSKVYELESQHDSVYFVSQENCSKLDFSQTSSNGETDKWEQKTIVNENQTEAKIEIRGKDNGIFVDCIFKKQNGKWLLVEVVDSST